MIRDVPTVGVRQGNVLRLSGGGYRAALFHLGALTRLNELGLLAGVGTIGAAGGGSIVAAVLAARVPWPLPGAYPRWPDAVAEPLRKIAASNLRSGPLLARPLDGSSTQIGLEDRYARQLVAEVELPGAVPQLVFGGAGMALAEMSAESEDGAIELRWKIDGCCEGGYERALVEESIAAVRTDLDAFGEGEQAVLENHGYLLADDAARASGHAHEPAAPPHPRWMHESRVRQALVASSRRMRRRRERAG